MGAAAVRITPQGEFTTPNALYDMQGCSYLASLLYPYFRRRRNRLGYSYPTIARIAKDVKRSPSTVKRGLRELQKLGWLDVQSGKDKFQRNTYQVLALKQPPRKAPVKRASRSAEQAASVGQLDPRKVPPQKMSSATLVGQIDPQKGLGSSCSTTVLGSSYPRGVLSQCAVSKGTLSPSARSVHALENQKGLATMNPGQPAANSDRSPVLGDLFPDTRVDSTPPSAANFSNSAKLARKGRALAKMSLDPRGFLEFWAVYPRKTDRQEALAIWKRRGLESMTAEIVEAVKKQSRTVGWLGHGGQYIPYPSTWLRKGRWEDEVKGYGGSGLPYLTEDTLHIQQAVAEARGPEGLEYLAQRDAHFKAMEAEYAAEQAEKNRQKWADHDAYLKRLQDERTRENERQAAWEASPERQAQLEAERVKQEEKAAEIARRKALFLEQARQMAEQEARHQ